MFDMSAFVKESQETVSLLPCKDNQKPMETGRWPLRDTKFAGAFILGPQSKKLIMVLVTGEPLVLFCYSGLSRLVYHTT